MDTDLENYLQIHLASKKHEQHLPALKDFLLASQIFTLENFHELITSRYWADAPIPIGARISFEKAEGLNIESAAKPKAIDVRSLLVRGLRGEEIDEKVFKDMKFYYWQKLDAFVRDNDSGSIVTTYRDTQRMPTTTAFEKLADQKAFRVNKCVNVGATHVFEAYRHSVPYVAKLITNEEECVRTMAYLDLDLHHPNIIEMEIMMNRFQHGRMLIAMPRMTGSLNQGGNPVFSPAELAKVIVDLLPALQYLHAHGLAYMDFKPANVGIDQNGNHVLIDLGSAVAFGEITPVTTFYLPADAKNDFLVSDAQWDFWGMGVTLVRLRGSITPKTRPTRKQVYQLLQDMQFEPISELLTILQETLPAK